MTRTKIAILGGGPAGLAAAWQLTHMDGWQDHYDVTVYQQGWRCGGKCATGRGPGDRIQEHGIHVLMGSYDSVFTILADVYPARARYGIAPESPFATWQDAFQRIDATLLSDSSDPTLIRWEAWPIVFPTNDDTPGQGPPPSLWSVIKDILGTGLSAILGSPYATSTGPIRRWILKWFFPEDKHLALSTHLADAIHDVESLASRALELALDPHHRRLHGEAIAKTNALVADLEGSALDSDAMGGFLDLLEHLLHGLERWAHLAGDVLSRDLALIEFALAALRGLLRDCWIPSEGKFDFTTIDHLDLRAWMKKHGAREGCLYGAPMRFLYAGTFSNDIGRHGDGGLFAAGTAMRSCFKMLAYKGSLVWQMRAGTGDTLIAPICQVLEARGVKFEYFTRVTNVHDAADGTIQTIDLAVQARVLQPPYRPLIPVTVEGGVVDAWPDHPLFDQLDPTDAREIEKVGWEHDCVRVPGHPKTLRYPEDFTHVILATPVATLPHVAPEIVERLPSWKRTVELVQTTPTQSFQLWFTDDNVALGVPLDQWGLQKPNLVPNNETYANGFTAWGDASVSAPYESWTPRPGAISYFCGAFSLTEPYDERNPIHYLREQKGAEARAQQWCTDNAGWIFRDATTKEQPYGLDYLRLAVPPGLTSRTAGERWAGQYFRANCEPSGQYTLTLPKTIAERLRFDDTGFENLLAAGDWVGHDGINAGFVDGAMLCGRQAALALLVRLGLPPTLVPELEPDVVPTGAGRG